jgi:transposase
LFPESVKREVIKLKLEGTLSNREVMEQFGIKKVSQIKTWVRWFQNGDDHRLAQPIEKQYSFGIERLKRDKTYLEMQVDVLKKYQEIEKR